MAALRPSTAPSRQKLTRLPPSLWLAMAVGATIGIIAIQVVASGPVLSSSEYRMPPMRILSVNMMSDEVLLALAPERLIGLSAIAASDSSNVVEEAKAIAIRVPADTEQILTLGPDLVVIGGHHRHVAAQMESLGIPLLTIQDFESIEWIRSLIRQMGARAGVPDRAEHVIAEMNAKIESISRRVANLPRPRVLLYSESGWVQGGKTTIDDAIRAAGRINLAAEMGIVGGGKISQERAIMADPDVILLRYSRIWESGFRQALLEDPAFRDVKALRDRRVYSIPVRLLVTSSHHIAETVETIARHLHPEAFSEPSS